MISGTYLVYHDDGVWRVELEAPTIQCDRCGFGIDASSIRLLTPDACHIGFLHAAARDAEGWLIRADEQVCPDCNPEEETRL